MHIRPLGHFDSVILTLLVLFLFLFDFVCLSDLEDSMDQCIFDSVSSFLKMNVLPSSPGKMPTKQRRWPLFPPRN